jgi:hypothetical protein
VFSVPTFIQYYGISDVCLSLPAVLNKEGVDRVLPLELNLEEADGPRRSAEVLQSTIAKLNLYDRKLQKDGIGGTQVKVDKESTSRQEVRSRSRVRGQPESGQK